MAVCRFKIHQVKKVIAGDTRQEGLVFTMSSWASWRDKRRFSPCRSSKSIKLARSMRYLQQHNRKNNGNMNCFKTIVSKAKGRFTASDSVFEIFLRNTHKASSMCKYSFFPQAKPICENSFPF